MDIWRPILATICALTLTNCSHTPFNTPPARITGPQNSVPGILESARANNRERISIFLTHGMNITPRCFGNEVSAMFDGRERPEIDNDNDSCVLPGDVNVIPVCLGETFLVSGEGLFGQNIRHMDSDCTEETADGTSSAPSAQTAGHQIRIGQFGRLIIQDVIVPATMGNGTEIPVRIYNYWWDEDAYSLQRPYLAADMASADPRDGESREFGEEEPGDGNSSIDQNRGERALGNRWLKDRVINQGFSDAVLYAGTFGRIMRRGMRSALCLMVLESQRDLSNTEQSPSHDHEAPCADLLSKENHGLLSDFFGTTQLALLSESLGSRILFDSLNGDEYTGRSGKTEGGAIGEFIKRMLGQNPVIYMSANQLPLLGLGQLRVTNAPGDNDKPSHEIESPEAPDSFLIQFLRENEIVAFFDPNDLLGYRAGIHMDPRLRQNIIEVTQHYATRWWVFASPMAAHAQSFADSDARAMILCGATEINNVLEPLTTIVGGVRRCREREPVNAPVE